MLTPLHRHDVVVHLWTGVSPDATTEPTAVPVGHGVTVLLKLVGAKLPLSPFALDVLEEVQSTGTALLARLIRQCRLQLESGRDPEDRPAAAAVLVSLLATWWW